MKSYKLAKQGDWLAYSLASDTRPDCKLYKCKFRKKRNPCTKEKTSGTKLAYITSRKGESDSLSLSIMTLDVSQSSLDKAFEARVVLVVNSLSVKSVVFDKSGEQLAFLESSDTNKRKVFELGYWNQNSSPELVYIDSTIQNIKTGWTVSEFRTPSFSRNGKKLFFGTNKIID